MAARKPPKNGRPWTPERVRERIRTGLLVTRIENQGLGELSKDQKMDSIQLDAAKFLVSLVVPKAEAPKDIHLTGQLNLTQLIEQTVSEG